jgi:ribosomal protein S18 acetylase RimI-like enzyme
MPEQIIIDYDAFSQSQYDANKTYHLVIDGGHGNANTDGSPSRLNDISVQGVKSNIAAAKNAGFTFKSITLTSCFSASFVPLFKDILADDGMIFCQSLSSTSNADKALSLATEYDNDLIALNLALLKNKFDATKALKSNAECFLSDAVYTKKNNTLHCFNFKNLDSALAQHNHIIAGFHQSEDTKQELEASQKYLQQEGIKLSTVSFDPDALEQTILDVYFRFDIRSMQPSDIEDIRPLDATIFPDKGPFDLGSYYQSNYSYLITDTKKNPAPIVAYLFSKPKGTATLFIGNIAVVPEYQGKGLGSKLLSQITTQANQEDKTLELQVLQNNKSAIRLYEKFGFEKTGETSDGYNTMSRKPHAPNALLSLIHGTTPGLIQTNYSFMLKFMAFSSAVSLLLLAAAFFPPLALIASTNYAVSAGCSAAGLISLGFFAYMSHHDNRQAHQVTLAPEL